MTAGKSDAKLFRVLARAAERRVWEFKPQELAIATWAFATAGEMDSDLFRVLARAVKAPIDSLTP